MARPTAAIMLLLFCCGFHGTHARLDNVVTAWINATQGAVAASGIQNQLSGKYYALVGLAIHQALTKGGAPPAALAAYAGHAINSASFPWTQSKYDVLIAKQLAGVSEADKQAAAAVVEPIATQLLRERAGDESTRWAQFKPSPPGAAKFAYEFTPGQTAALYPQLAKTTPFVVTSSVVDAVAFNRDKANGPVFQPPKDDYKATLDAGAKKSKTRSQYDTDSAFFWADGANTSAISGHWLDIAREVLPEGLSLADTALFYARAGAGAYAASIAAWKVKYTTLHWRPITAFRAGFDGQAAVPDWEPLLPTPPHPEYPSGHQATVGAILEVLLRTLGGKDAVTFKISSEGTPWLTRSYKSLTAAATEVGDSRLFAGVHFKSANDDGLRLGRILGAKVFDALGGGGGGGGGTSKVASEKAPAKHAAGRRMKA